MEIGHILKGHHKDVVRVLFKAAHSILAGESEISTLTEDLIGKTYLGNNLLGGTRLNHYTPTGFSSKRWS